MPRRARDFLRYSSPRGALVFELQRADIVERIIGGAENPWRLLERRDPAQHMANMKSLQEWYTAGKIKPLITERLSLEQATDAIVRISQRQTIGKIVINP